MSEPATDQQADPHVARDADVPLARLLAWSDEAIVHIHADGRIGWASPGTVKLVGGSPPLAERRIQDLVHPDDLANTLTTAERLLELGGAATLHCRVRNSEDRPWRRVEVRLHDQRSDPVVAGFVAIMQDAPLVPGDSAALRDPLTGLATRQLFRDRLAQAVTRNHRDPATFAVLLLDVARFRHVNDTLGHAAGDDLLKAVAALLRASLRESDTAARLGDDEFAVLLEDLDTTDRAEQIAGRLSAALAEPIPLAGSNVAVEVSIGIVYNDAEPEASVEEVTDALMRDATLAMQEARRIGPGQHVRFQRDHHTDALQRIGMESGLVEALRSDQFILHYQPIVALSDGIIVGLESLIRWRHPELGLISPDNFIPVAEETGLIVGIGAWVLKEACRQIAEWQRRFPSTHPLGVSVNVSPVQFRRGDVVRDVAAALSLSGLDAAHLTLEITESTLIEDVELVAETLGRLKALGVRLALDDFGTGYSSLAHLQNFPFDVLKIDRAFIRDSDDAKRTDLARAIIDLGRNLDLVTVAEGIERPDQLDKFRDLEAVYGQGYLFSRPGRGVEIEALLAARSRSVGYLS